MKPTERYYAQSLRRSYCRRKAKKEYKALIQKNKNARILVILHLFYDKSWAEIKEYLKNLEDYSWDFCVTITENQISEQTVSDIKRYKPDVHITVCDNLGYDVAPFLKILKQVDLNRYDIVFKLQSKGTKRRWIYIYNCLFLRRDWFRQLYDGILSASNVHETIEKLNRDPQIGMVAAKRLIVEDPVYKQQLIKKIAEEKGIRIPDRYRFVAGTCFAVKAKCLQPIQKLIYSEEEFKPSSAGSGLSYAHFIERYFCIAVSAAGYQISGNAVLYKKDILIHRAEHALSRRSVGRLLETVPDIEPEWIFSHLDNRLMTVTRKKTALSDLRMEQKDLNTSCGSSGRRRPILIDEKNHVLYGEETARVLYQENGGSFWTETVQIRLLDPKSRIKAMLPGFIKRRYFGNKGG